MYEDDLNKNGNFKEIKTSHAWLQNPCIIDETNDLIVWVWFYFDEWHFKNNSRCARLGVWGRFQENAHVQTGKIRSHCRKHLRTYNNFPRCAQLGAMLRYLERNFSGRSWWKDRFSKNNITCVLIFQTKFLGGDLDEKIDFQSVMFFKFITVRITRSEPHRKREKKGVFGRDGPRAKCI